MTITSLSFAFMQYSNTPDRVRTPPPAAPAPASRPEPVATSSNCGAQSCDSPRRSPLFRALADALGSMVDNNQPAHTTSGAAPTPSAAAIRASSNVAGAIALDASTEAAADAQTTSAMPAAEKPTVDLEEAVMNFAQALMQALRGGHPGDDQRDGEGHGRRHHHHHAHHDHGRVGWGDPAQRVEQLGVRMGATQSAARPVDAATMAVAAVTSEVAADRATTASTVTATAKADNSEAANVPIGDTVLDPVKATSLAAASAPLNTMIYVKLSIDDGARSASPLSRVQSSLLESFGTLQQALGLPAVDSDDSLKSQLSAFLQALAGQLRGGDANTFASTQPGALLSVTA